MSKEDYSIDIGAHFDELIKALDALPKKISGKLKKVGNKLGREVGEEFSDSLANSIDEKSLATMARGMERVKELYKSKLDAMYEASQTNNARILGAARQTNKKLQDIQKDTGFSKINDRLTAEAESEVERARVARLKAETSLARAKTKEVAASKDLIEAERKAALSINRSNTAAEKSRRAARVESEKQLAAVKETSELAKHARREEEAANKHARKLAETADKERAESAKRARDVVQKEEDAIQKIRLDGLRNQAAIEAKRKKLVQESKAKGDISNDTLLSNERLKVARTEAKAKVKEEIEQTKKSVAEQDEIKKRALLAQARDERRANSKIAAAHDAVWGRMLLTTKKTLFEMSRLKAKLLGVSDREFFQKSIVIAQIKDAEKARRKEQSRSVKEWLAEQKGAIKQQMSYMRSQWRSFRSWSSSLMSSNGLLDGRRYGRLFQRGAHRSLLNLRQILIASSVYGAIEGVKNVVEEASTHQEAANFSISVFGEENAEELKKWAGTVADTLGMTAGEAIQATNQFALFGKTMGLLGDDLVDFAKNKAKLAADMAEALGTKASDASTAIIAALRNEQEPIRKYGILINEYTNTKTAYENGLVETSAAAEKARIAIDQANRKMDKALAGLSDAEKHNMQADIQNALSARGQAMTDIAIAEAKYAAEAKKSGKASAASVAALNRLEKARTTLSKKDKAYEQAVTKWAKISKADLKNSDEFLAARKAQINAQEQFVRATQGGAAASLTPDVRTKAIDIQLEQQSKMLGITGQFEKSVNNYANALKIFQSNVGNLKTAIGYGLLPTLTRLFKFFNRDVFSDRDMSSMSKSIHKWAKSVGDSISKYFTDKFGSGREAVDSMTEAVISFGKRMWSALGNVFRLVLGLFEDLKAALDYLGLAIDTANGKSGGFKRGWESTARTIRSLWRIILEVVVGGLARLIANSGKFTAWYEDFSHKVKEFATRARETSDSVWSIIKAIAGFTLVTKIIGFLGFLTEKFVILASGAKTAWTAIQKVLKVGKFAPAAGAAGGTAASGGFLAMLGPIGAIVAAISAAAMGMMAFRETFRNWSEESGLLGEIAGIVVVLQDTIEVALAAIKKNIQNLWEESGLAKLFGPDAKSGLMNMIKTQLLIVVAAISAAFLVILGVIQALTYAVRALVWLVKNLFGIVPLFKEIKAWFTDFNGQLGKTEQRWRDIAKAFDEVFYVFLEFFGAADVASKKLESIITKVEAVFIVLQNRVYALLRWFTGIGVWFENIGTAISTGIKRGIDKVNPFAALKTNALGLAGWFEDRFQIRSPSRVMASIGKNIVLGLETGITRQSGDSMASIESSFNKIAESIYGSIDGAGGGASVGGGNTFSSETVGGMSVVNHFYVTSDDDIIDEVVTGMNIVAARNGLSILEA